MWVPGLAGGAMALLVLLVVRDRPENCGFAPVEAAPRPSVSSNAGEGPSRASIRAALMATARQPAIWSLAFTYFFIYIVRQGVSSWLVFYLMEAKGVGDAAQVRNTAHKPAGTEG